MILGQDIPNYAKLDARMTDSPNKQNKTQMSSKQTHRANRVLIRENPHRESSETSLPQLPSRTTFSKKISTNKQNTVPGKKIIIDTIADYISTESKFEPHHNQTFASLEDLKHSQEKLPIIPLALISPKEGSADNHGGQKDTRPSFLAPTVAALQHFKDKNLKKDAGAGKGFVFSRPKDKAPKYDPLLQSQTPEEHAERARRGLANPYPPQLHQSASADRTSSKKSSNIILKPFNKESSPRGIGTFELSHDSILAKNHTSSIMANELETRWGYRHSISDIDENEEENLDEKESNRTQNSPTENKRASPKTPLKKSVVSISQGSSLKLKTPTTSSNLHSLDAYLKSAKAKSNFFSGGVRERIWANKVPKKAESTEKSPRSPTTQTNKFFSTSSTFGQSSPKRVGKKDDVFQSGFGTFFQFNKDNKFFDSFDKYNKPNDRAYLSQNSNKGSIPVMVSLGQNDRIIQPSYMKDSGSMCITEFWPKKYNVMFYYHLKDTANHIRVRREGRENEVMYRPNQWEKQDKIKRMNDSSHYLPSTSITHTQTVPDNKLDTSSISGGAGHNSPSKQKKRYTSLWQDSNQDSPTIVGRMHRASIRRQPSSEIESKFSQRSFDIRIEDPSSKQPEIDLEKFKVQSSKAVYLPRSLRHPDHEIKKNVKSRSINVSAR